MSLILLWSFILVRYSDGFILLCRNPKNSSDFGVKLSGCGAHQGFNAFSIILENIHTDSESVSRLHLHLLAALRNSRAAHNFGGRAEKCWLVPSRGSPAPVHGSELPDQPDRTPSRTACSSSWPQLLLQLHLL